MTYAGFHLSFIVPPLVLLFFLAKTELHIIGKPAWTGLFALAAMALVYTTPWDNYLIYKEVWWYGADRVLGTLFFVPLEEYAFFILQTFATGFLFLRLAKVTEWKNENRDPVLRITLPIAMLAMGLSILLLFTQSGFYLGLILVWALPVIFIQWYLGGKILLHRWKPYLLSLSISTIYLCFADAFAIRENIWSISKNYTTGLNIGGLPIEEATFFLVTNLMVIQGLCLFLDPNMKATLNKWIKTYVTV